MFRSLRDDNKGMAYILFFLLLLPFTFMLSVSMLEITKTSGTVNANFKKAIETSVKGATAQVSSSSQAHGTPMIIPEIAHEIFKELLARNLVLDKDTLNPLVNGNGVSISSVNTPVRYWFLVYNGVNSFGLPEGELYYYSTEGDVLLVDFNDVIEILGANEARFYLSGEGFLDISQSAEAVRQVRFNRPGVIAIVQAEVRPLILNQGKISTRWASARIVTN